MTGDRVSACDISLLSPAGTYQHVILPRPGRKFVFDVTPGASYASEGEEYTASYGPNIHFDASTVYLTSVERGTGCYDRISAWEYAKWRYV
jgi:hypothetical protein